MKICGHKKKLNEDKDGVGWENLVEASIDVEWGD